MTEEKMREREREEENDGRKNERKRENDGRNVKKSLPETKTLARYEHSYITDVKSSILLATDKNTLACYEKF